MNSARALAFTGALSAAFLLCGQEPEVGGPVDIAAFGHKLADNGCRGVEWDEPRIVESAALEYAAEPPAGIRLEYWVSTWPQAQNGGWTKTDTTWQGEWRRLEAHAARSGRSVTFAFAPLSENENPNARNAPGYAPLSRTTLKIRACAPTPPSDLRTYGRSRWALRHVVVEAGCEGKPAAPVSVEAYNGQVVSVEPLPGGGAGVRLRVWYAEHEPGSTDRTILTVHAGAEAFGVAMDDVIERKSVYVRPLGVFVGDAASGASFARYVESGQMRIGQDVISRVSGAPEQTFANAFARMPRLAMTHRSGHPLRYLPLGFPGSREKYGLDFNGNLFISKHSAKAMEEDLAAMQWEGDQIYFRIATGAAPDFREYENSATQELLETFLPIVRTKWVNGGIEYEEQAYATLLTAPLDPERLRGDEPSFAFLRLRAYNPRANAAPARVWLQVSPDERLQWKGGLLLAAGNRAGVYPRPRLRAAADTQTGAVEVTPLPAPLSGQAALWSVMLPPGESRTIVWKIPFRTFDSDAPIEAVRVAAFEKRLDETVAYWRRVTGSGMRIRVPDEELNRFYETSLQHILLTTEKDGKTGYTMCPCATYDYNMFANETAIQVRMLDMRGLHELAWRCLQPIVELQGSKALPGRFRNTDAAFHGVRIDAGHDYTHSGYNLNHGWILWTMAEHYQFTRDDAWLKSVAPRLLTAANWIIEERKATMQLRPDGSKAPEYGLLPAGQLEDNEDFAYWFAVNAYAYRGLRAAASVLSALDPAASDRLQREADAYRADIRAAVDRAVAITPVMPLRDGTFVPAVPPRASLHGRDLGWIRNILYGAHTLVDCGVIDAAEPLAGWILQDYEDNLFMSDESLGVPDRDWFDRGGVTLQPNLVNTVTSYVSRDQIPQAIRAFYNTFAMSYYPDIAAFTEWIPSLGVSGGPFFKTSDEAAFITWLRLMLVREDGGTLLLNSGAPRAWFRPAESIQVSQSPTFFGSLSFRTESHVDRGYIDALVELPAALSAKEIKLRLRHPGTNPITRVEVDGQDSSAFDAAKESVSVPVTRGTHRIRAYYRQ